MHQQNGEEINSVGYVKRRKVIHDQVDQLRKQAQRDAEIKKLLEEILL